MHVFVCPKMSRSHYSSKFLFLSCFILELHLYAVTDVKFIMKLMILL